MEIKDTIWEIGLAVIMGAIALFVAYKIGSVQATSAGAIFNESTGNWMVSNGTDYIVVLNTSTAPSTVWTQTASEQLTGNVSLIGLVLVIGLVAAVIVKTKIFS